MEAKNRKHLVIVDGHHLMYRAYWAIPRTMKNGKGEQTNIAFGMASMLIMILKTEQPDSLLFCFDADEDTFRHKEYAEYKAGRSATPDDFYPQVPRALAMIDAFGTKSVSGGAMEADDFACAYAKEAEKDGQRVTIITGDRDLFQLCNDNIRVAIPHKGYQAAEYMGPAEVRKKYGVTPDQIPSYKGLVGDASDNLHGVHGIGPKAAESLLQEYGTLTNLYENIEKVKPAWKEKLLADKESAFFCERMATLICDMKLPVPLKDLAYTGIDPKPTIDAFHDLGFTLVMRRFLSMLETPYGQAHFLPPPENALFLGSPSYGAKKEVAATKAEAQKETQLSLL